MFENKDIHRNRYRHSIISMMKSRIYFSDSKQITFNNKSTLIIKLTIVLSGGQSKPNNPRLIPLLTMPAKSMKRTVEFFPTLTQMNRVHERRGCKQWAVYDYAFSRIIEWGILLHIDMESMLVVAYRLFYWSSVAEWRHFYCKCLPNRRHEVYSEEELPSDFMQVLFFNSAIP